MVEDSGERLFGLAVDEGVPEKFALPLKGLPGISRILHQGNFLCDEPRDVQEIGIGLLSLPLIERMLSVNIDDRSFRETFGSLFSIVVDTD